MTELLPCPFCGKPAERCEFDDHAMRFVNYSVGCTNHDCLADYMVLSTESADAADKAWNTRAPIVNDDAMVGSFVEQAAKLLSGAPFPSARSYAKAREVCDLALSMFLNQQEKPE